MPDSSFKLESPSLGPEQSVHVEYQEKLSRGVRRKLPIDPREVNGHLTVFKIGQNLDFLHQIETWSEASGDVWDGQG